MVPVTYQLLPYCLRDRELYFTSGNWSYYGMTWSTSRIHIVICVGAAQFTLLDFCLDAISSTFRGGYWSYKQYIEQLPIRTIDFANPADVARHDQMVALVERMLDLHKRLAAESVPHVKTVLAAPDRRDGPADRWAGV